jgi:hypothetical protein
MPPSGRTSFAALLRHILVTEQNRKLKDVAEEVGLSSRNFYGRVTGRIQFTPDEINRVLRAVPDPRLGEWLLAHTDLTCTRRIAPAPRDPTASAVDLAMSSVEESMAALRSVLRMRPTDTMADDAMAGAEGHIDEAQRQLTALQMTLRASAARAAHPQPNHAPPRVLNAG